MFGELLAPGGIGTLKENSSGEKPVSCAGLNDNSDIAQ